MAVKKTQPARDTDVILLIKGAGNQKPDDHLNLFLSGFWPAVISLCPNATLHQRRLEDLKPTPHDEKPHKHYTEILTHDKKGAIQRVWLKETYWEPEVTESVPGGNILKEWRMASFAFGNMFIEWATNRNNQDLRDCRLTSDLKQKIELENVLIRNNLKRLPYVLGFYLMFLLLGFPFIPFQDEPFWWIIKFPQIVPLLIVLVGSFLLALPPAWEYRKLIEERTFNETFQGKDFLKSLPAFPNWTFFAMILLLITFPDRYFTWILFLAFLQVTLILSRRILWNYREFVNSDTDITDYYEYEENEKKRIGKVEKRWRKLYLSPLLYRYFVFWLQPIFYIGWLVIRFLKWTRILGGIGELLEKAIHIALTGYLGDVVNYAMNPAQAHRIRSVIENEIDFFTNQMANVRYIHVVAHSQGTPITYETLFHYLEENNQQKIFTYVTLGSVLSYYYQARGVLDEIYHRRFPVDQKKKPSFAKNFKWMNFWNFADFITEFYGLDEYIDLKKEKLSKNGLARSNTSPTNIKTRDSIPLNHGEYWSNLDHFQIPFAKRVLGIQVNEKGRPDEWNPPLSLKTPRGLHHSGWVFVLWIGLLIAVTGFGWLLYFGANTLGVPAFVSELTGEISSIIQSLLPPPDPDSLTNKLIILRPTLSAIFQLVLFILYVLLGFAAILESIAQFRRNKNLGKVRGNSVDLNRLHRFSVDKTQKELLQRILAQTEIRTTLDLVKYAGPKKGRKRLAYTLLTEEEWTSKNEQDKNSVVEEKMTLLTEVAMSGDLMRIEDVNEDFAKTLIDNNIHSIDELSNLEGALLEEFTKSLQSSESEKIEGLKKQAKKLENLLEF